VVTLAGGEQRDVAGEPADVEQQVDRLVGDVLGVAVRRDEVDVDAVVSARRHPGRPERAERVVDLLGVAKEATDDGVLR
jgi:hypothetical protein